MAPLLSFVVLTDTFATIQRVVGHLVTQTIADRIELIAVCPNPARCELPEAAVAPLGGAVVVESPLLPMGEARAAGVRAATAPVVVLGETHAFPAPDWAAHIVAALEGPWDAVAPGMTNGNPESARSWSGLLMDYGRWFHSRQAGAIDEPPAYNAAWKRDTLLAAGDRLPRMLEPGGPLDPAIAARSAGFQHVPNANMAHLNVARPWPWVAERYWAGRLFGARRSHDWPLARRLVYFGGSVLVPFIRFARTRPLVALARGGERIPAGTLGAVAGGSLIWAVGEAAGYIAGAGRAEARMLELELHKERYT